MGEEVVKSLEGLHWAACGFGLPKMVKKFLIFDKNEDFVKILRKNHHNLKLSISHSTHPLSPHPSPLTSPISPTPKTHR